jgi:hypothetical protein
VLGRHDGANHHPDLVHRTCRLTASRRAPALAAVAGWTAKCLRSWLLSIKSSREWSFRLGCGGSGKWLSEEPALG